MRKLKTGDEVLLQKHIREGNVNIKNVILINIIIAISLLISSTLVLGLLFSGIGYGWLGIVWFLWGLLGLCSHKIKPKSLLLDTVFALPAHLCTYGAAYIISGVYWVVSSFIIKNKNNE